MAAFIETQLILYKDTARVSVQYEFNLFSKVGIFAVFPGNYSI